ncbi:NAD(P)/FAD-dependent oxidoreductase [Pontibacillus marinus]|uniref:FAD-dependent pyridine nucleotide-disulfide oxidoreductase n=1 Tax=Pontibacillus marinus BH030004 = DSM 16465 TaxID=1385511 RepID=A0A0A5FVP7_9BACI|nr:NAD(P)/FAD-dependent oxidoreductase [Pontibacillus marinus]KGX83984.1 FAD-dependent pyridine nucleotide-disulfide oxidoreductase [Pontibacillus marinus BH030004 = DSM 16465]
MQYDCIIIGGGIAGLQASIQLGRYAHRVLILDAGSGRSSLCRRYQNILGYADGVSGQDLRENGRMQAGRLGVEMVSATVTDVKKQDATFMVKDENENVYSGKRLLFATGVQDNLPSFENLYPCLGMSLYICPDCDGYEVTDKKTIVMGSGNIGANMALTLTYWTEDLVYINDHGEEIDDEIDEQLQKHQIHIINKPITELLTEGSQFKGVQLTGGGQVTGEKGFFAYGGNKVKADLAKMVGVETHQNNHIVTDPRTKETSEEHVWAAGDVAAHSELVTIAMGEGSQAAIWIHKSLLG